MKLNAVEKAVINNPARAALQRRYEVRLLERLGGRLEDGRADEGHVHIALDGAVVAMAYGDAQTLKGLTPGQHSLQVDFVAVDHVPFRNRVTAAVLFSVK